MKSGWGRAFHHLKDLLSLDVELEVSNQARSIIGQARSGQLLSRDRSYQSKLTDRPVQLQAIIDSMSGRTFDLASEHVLSAEGQEKEISSREWHGPSNFQIRGRHGVRRRYATVCTLWVLYT